MTICIAALADDGKSIVLASDREVTYGFPINTELDSGVRKIQKVTEKIFVLIAGNSLIGAELAEEIKLEKSGATSIREVAEALRAKYIKSRLQVMERLYIEPRGLTYEKYLEKQKDMNQQVVSLIDNGLSQDTQSFQLSFIVAGIDESGGHIYGIFHPGIMSLMDVSGFCAIGIGDVHAVNSLIGNKYTKESSLRESLFYIYDAKKRSEVAPGVGIMTDMLTITEQGPHELTETEIKELDEIRKRIKDSFEKQIQKELISYKLAGKKVVEKDEKINK